MTCKSGILACTTDGGANWQALNLRAIDQAYQEQLRDNTGCSDVELWVSGMGATCSQYEEEKWCTTGGYGPGSSSICRGWFEMLDLSFASLIHFYANHASPHLQTDEPVLLVRAVCGLSGWNRAWGTFFDYRKRLSAL